MSDLNQTIQNSLYTLIDSKSNGLADCNTTEIVDAVASGITYAIGAVELSLSSLASDYTEQTQGILDDDLSDLTVNVSEGDLFEVLDMLGAFK